MRITFLRMCVHLKVAKKYLFKNFPGFAVVLLLRMRKNEGMDNESKQCGSYLEYP